MLHCKFCKAQLKSADVETGRCPVCEKPLTARDSTESSGTPPDSSADSGESIDKIIDSNDTIELPWAEATTVGLTGEDGGGQTVSDGDEAAADDAAAEIGDTIEIPASQQPAESSGTTQAGSTESEDSLATLPIPAPGIGDDTVDFPVLTEGQQPATQASGEGEGASAATMPLDGEAKAPDADIDETIEIDHAGKLVVPVPDSAGDEEQKTIATVELDADASAPADDEDAITTLDVQAGDAHSGTDTEDDLATQEMEPGDQSPGPIASVSGTGSLANMIDEISAGEREYTLEDKFADDLEASGSAIPAAEDAPGTDSIDEAEQMATLPIENNAADNAGEDDSIDVAESVDTYQFQGDDKSAGDQADKTIGDQESGSDDDTQQTILSDEISADGSYEKTIASDDLPNEVLQSMKAAWVTADMPGITPGMTVKAEDEFSKTGGAPTPETSLVIKLRRLIEADKKGAAEAEYELVRVLGEGGMGIVYLARQTSIDRFVAIKMLKPKTAKKKDQRLKFLAEAVVTSDLDHPNIVPIYDVGSNDSGALFYSMKKVEGTPWLEVIKQNSLEENLDVLDSVANAVSFAHARGVLHRDLKPENVMLGEFGEVLLMDWGLAQPTKDFRKKGSIVESRSMGGTPAYMAPEMATGPLKKIGPHSDIYLLGAILFEIITGKPPHRGVSAMKCLMSAAKNEIRSVEETGELMDIAMQAMATDPADRYADVKSFQSAIKEYLSHTESVDLSIRADEELRQAEESDVYDDYARCLFGFQKAYELWNGNDRAQAGISDTRLAYAGSAMRKGDFDLGAGLLDVDIPEHAALHAKLVKGKAEIESRARALKRAKRAGIGGVIVFLIGMGVAFYLVDEQRGKAVIAQGKAEDARKDAEAQKEIAVEKTKVAEVATQDAEAQKEIADDKTIVAEVARKDAEAQKEIADDKTIIAEVARNDAVDQKKEAELQTEIAKYRGYISTIGLAKAKIDENAFDTARVLLKKYSKREPGERDLRNWEWGRLMYLCSQEERTFTAGVKVLAIDVSRRGERRLVTALAGGIVKVWDIKQDKEQNDEEQNGKLLLTIEVAAAGTNVNAVAISPDGNKIATGTNAKSDRQQKIYRLKLWNIKTGEELLTFGDSNGKHTAEILSVRFSDDGRWLVSGSKDHTARVWDVESGKQLAVLQGHNSWVWDAAFSPDDPATKQDDETGTRIVTVGDDGIAIVWKGNPDNPKQPWTDPAKIGEPAKFTGHYGPRYSPVYSVAFSPNGKKVVTGGYDRRILIWDPMQVAPYDWDNLQRFHENEKLRLASGRRETAALRLRADVYQRLKRALAGNEELKKNLQDLVGDEHIKPAAIYRVLAGHIGGVRSVRFFPKAKKPKNEAEPDAADDDTNVREELLVLSSGDDGTVKVWKVATGTAIKTFRGHDQEVPTCAVASDGKSVFSGSGDGTARQWSTFQGKGEIREFDEIRELAGREFTGHDGEVLSAAFSLDNKRFVTAGEDRTARRWMTDTEGKTTFLEYRAGHDYLVSSALFFPDGKRMLTAAVDDWVRIWDVSRGTETRKLKETGRRGAIALSSDEKWILTGSSKRFSFGKDNKGWKRDDNNGVWTAKLWNAGIDEADGTTQFLIVGSDSANDRTHAAEVTAVAFSPDSKTLFTGDATGRGYLWRLDAADPGKPTVIKLHSLTGHTPGQRIVAARFLPDGSRVLTASTDNSVAQWDVETGRERKDLMLRHDDSLTGMDVSSDGDRTIVLTSSADLTVRLWNAETAEEIGRLQSEGGVNALARNVKKILKRRKLEPWDLWDESKSVLFDLNVKDEKSRLEEQEKRKLVEAWDEEVVERILDPKKRKKPAGFDKTVEKLSRLLNVTRARLLRPFINSVDLSANGLRALTTNIEDRMVHLWNLKQDLKTEQQLVNAKRTDQNQPFLAGKPVDLIEAAIFSPVQVQANAGQSVLTVGGADAQMWDVVSGRERTRYSTHGAVSAVGYYSSTDPNDPDLIVTSGLDGTARIWDAESGKTKWILDLRTEPDVEIEVNSAVFSHDGKKVLTASSDKRVQSWSVETGKSLMKFVGHNAAVRQAVYSSNDQYVLTASDDGTARIWDAATGKELAQLKDRHDNMPVLCAAFSSHDTRIITGGADSQAIIWALDETADGKIKEVNGKIKFDAILRLTGHTAPVTSVAFAPSPDPNNEGNRALTGSDDYTVKLWDARTEKDIERFVTTDKQNADEDAPVEAPLTAQFVQIEQATEVMSLAGHNREVTSVAFSHDGNRVLTGSRDRKAIIWRAIDWRSQEAKARISRSARSTATGKVVTSK